MDRERRLIQTVVSTLENGKVVNVMAGDYNLCRRW